VNTDPQPTPPEGTDDTPLRQWPVMPEALIRELERVRALPPCATRIEQIQRDSLVNEAIEALRRLQHVGRRVHNAYSSLLRVE
jgi:hypothetical protein